MARELGENLFVWFCFLGCFFLGGDRGDVHVVH